MTMFTALCSQAADEACGDCHKNIVHDAAHRDVACIQCHEKSEKHFKKAGVFGDSETACLKCHQEYKGITHSQMATREKEKQRVKKAFEQFEPQFFDKTCSGCHVSSCSDCHSADDKHGVTLPENDNCLTCHKEYFTGIEYEGLGMREYHKRFQRGIEKDGVYYRKMLPDVHHEKGMQCASCHSMANMAGNADAASCTSCHTELNRDIVEHKIDAHIQKMECYTCHSAWASSEHGSYYIRLSDSPYYKYYAGVRTIGKDLVRSAYSVQAGSFALGVNDKGKYSPVRPQFQYFYTKVNGTKPVYENVPLTLEYKAFFPHTVRRKTVMCASCHENDRRLLNLPDDERIMLPDKDGLNITTFYNSRFMTIYDGRFLTDEEIRRIKDTQSKEYKRYTVEKWQRLTR